MAPRIGATICAAAPGSGRCHRRRWRGRGGGMRGCVANSAKRKGDRAELEVQGLLRELLGVPARRKLGAGRRDDVGDIDGVRDTVIQVVDWRDIARAVRAKPVEAEEQRLRSRGLGEWVEDGERVVTWAYLPCAFAATFVRLRGGDYRVVLTPEQWAAYWREAVG